MIQYVRRAKFPQVTFSCHKLSAACYHICEQTDEEGLGERRDTVINVVLLLLYSVVRKFFSALAARGI
jgi:hypothetical protein